MIVSYETLRNLTVHLNNCKIGLLLCDEGHRLKNSGMLSLGFSRVFVPTIWVNCRVSDISGPQWP